MPRIDATVGPGGAYMPLIPIRIVRGTQVVEGPAVIDSGADTTIIPAELLPLLGVAASALTWEPGAGGAGGSFSTADLDATVTYGRWTVATRIKVASAGALTVALLGRADFFQHFVVRFSWHKTPPCFDVDPVVNSKGR